MYPSCSEAPTRASFVTRIAELLDMLAPQFAGELQQRIAEDDSFVELVRSAIQQKLTATGPLLTT